MKNVSLKMDEATIAQIERFAQENKLTISSAYRILLARALGEELETRYISEVVNRIQSIVRGNVGTMLARWEKELVKVLSASLDTSAEAVAAELPAVTEEERESVNARSPGEKIRKAPPGPKVAPVAPEEEPVELEPEEDEPTLEPEEEQSDEDLAAAVDDEIADAEKLYWENYATMLSEIGEDEPTQAVADEAAKIVRNYNKAAVEAGWKPPVWGTDDFNARKSAAFPQGGVRGRR